MDDFKTILDQQRSNTYELITNKMSTGLGGAGVAAGMGVGAIFKDLSPVLDTITASGNEVIASFTNIHEAADWLATQYRLKAMEGSLTPEMREATKELFEQFKMGMMPAHLAAFSKGFQGEQWAEFEAALDAILNPVIEAEEELEGQLEGIAEGTDTIESIMAQLTGDWAANRVSSAQMTTDFEGMASLTLAGYYKVLESMKKLNAMGYSLTTRNIQRDAAGNITTPNILQWGGSTGKEYRVNLSEAASNFYKDLQSKKNSNVTIKQAQHGGMINEQIWGMGESGQRYTFGEAGPEMVTPMTGGKNTLGNITANITVNIDKVLHDIDLEQIKPIVERALLEVHSRRGII